MMVGTLLRLIPLDVKWSGKVAKFRVEIGDLGKAPGTVEFDPVDKVYVAYFFDWSESPPQQVRSIGDFETPEEAALAIAGGYFRIERLIEANAKAVA